MFNFFRISDMCVFHNDFLGDQDLNEESPRSYESDSWDDSSSSGNQPFRELDEESFMNLEVALATNNVH